MADVNVNALAEQAPAMAPPTHTDDQILPRSRWVLHANFRAFIASLTIPSIYIQQFWDTVRYDKTTGSYSCQLDEQWFDLTKDTLRDALQITPVDNNNAFSSPPTPDVLIKFVNDLGYPKVVKTLSDVVTNDMLQILWGVVKRAHIDYVERMWEEFTQSIHTFIEDKKNLAQHTQGKKKATLIVIPSVRFTKLIIHHLQSKHKFHPRPSSPLHFPNEELVLGYIKFSAKGTKKEVFGMPIPNNLITADIQGEQYYNAYLEKVAKHQRYLADEEVSDPDSPTPKPAKATKPKATKQSMPLAPKAAPVTKPAAAKAPKTTASRPPKPTPATTEPSKKDQSKKRKLVKESSEAPSPAKRPKADSKEKNPTDQLIFQRRTSTPTESFGHDESSSLYAELGLTDSESESDEELSGIEPTSSAGTLSSLQHLDKELSFANQFLMEKSQEDKPKKTNTELEVSKAVDEIVTDAVDWAIQAPLGIASSGPCQNLDMKEILHHRMWESNSYQAHKDHKMLYEALEKSMARDHTDKLLTDLAKTQRKKKKRRDSPKTPPGSPPHQPPPPPPPTGSSRTPRAFGASGYFSIASSLLFLSSNHTASVMTNRTCNNRKFPVLPYTDLPVPVNNWASTLASTYAPLLENSLLPHTGDMAIFMDWPALSFWKMKAAYYSDVSLEQMVPDQMWIEEECKLHEEDPFLPRVILKKYTIAERDFKYLYPSDFEDLYSLNLQGHLNHLSPEDKKILTTAVNLWTRNLIIRQRVEDF
ncbi:hypothetical protein Tco_0912192 [Tanacetum coccineum]